MGTVPVKLRKKRRVASFGQEYILVSDSQHVEDILEQCGVGNPARYGFLLVLVDSSGAEWAEVWASRGNVVPYLDCTVELVYN